MIPTAFTVGTEVWPFGSGGTFRGVAKRQACNQRADTGYERPEGSPDTNLRSDSLLGRTSIPTRVDGHWPTHRSKIADT